MKKIKFLITSIMLILVITFSINYVSANTNWSLIDGYYYYDDIILVNSYDSSTEEHILTADNNQFIEYKKRSSSTWITAAKNIKLILETPRGSTGNRRWDIYIVELDSQNRPLTEPTYIDYATEGLLQYQFRYADYQKPDNYDTVDDLLITTGSPFTTTGTMGDVVVVLDGYNLDLQITYAGTVRNLNYLLDTNNDLTPFRANNAVYFTDDGYKYIAFSHDKNNSMIVPAGDVDEFIPYTIFNLTTNQMRVFDSISVYMHLEVDNIFKRDIYGYFYMDQFVIDNLEAATVIYDWRYKYSFGINGQWFTTHADVEAGETTLSKISGFSKFLNIMAAGIPYIFNDELFDKTIPQIQKVTNWNDELISKASLENYYTINYPDDFERIKDGMDVYKLYLGNHNRANATGVEIDPESISVINIAFTKDGYLNTINAKDIDTKGSIGEGLKPQPQNPSLWDMIKDFFKASPLIAWSITIVLFLLFVLPIITKIRKNIKRAFR